MLLTFAQGDGSQGKNPKPYSYINYADEPITIHEYHFPMCSQEEE